MAMITQCLRCSRVALAADVAWLSVMIESELTNDILSLCTDCQRELRWGPQNFACFVRRQAEDQLTTMMRRAHS